MEKLADAQARGDVSAIVQLQAAIKFNGGGHLNHSIFWQARERERGREAADTRVAALLIPVVSPEVFRAGGFQNHYLLRVLSFRQEFKNDEIN